VSIDEIIRGVEAGRVVAIAPEDLGVLLDRADAVHEDDTAIAGRIRTLSLGGRILVQERTPDGDHFVRGLGSAAAAVRFVGSRLASYERMWDG
jgi:hypothetical protein